MDDESTFNAGYDRKFTTNCYGRFYEDTTITGATHKKEREQRQVEKHVAQITEKSIRVQEELDKMNVIRKKIERQEQREAQRIIVNTTAAITFLQRIWRGAFVRKRLRSIKAVCIIERNWIKVCLRDQARIINQQRRDERHLFNAATCVSRFIRNVAVFQQNARKKQVQHRSAIMMQRSLQSFVARKKVMLRKTQRVQTQMEWQAALTIQRIFKGFIVRESVNDILYYIIQAQAAIRGYLVRKQQKLIPPTSKTSQFRTKIMAAIGQQSKECLKKEKKTHVCSRCSRCSSTKKEPESNQISTEDVSKRPSYREWFKKKTFKGVQKAREEQKREEMEKQVNERSLMEREDRSARVLRKFISAKRNYFIKKEKPVKDIQVPQQRSKASAQALAEYHVNMRMRIKQRTADELLRKQEANERLCMDREDRAVRILRKQKSRLLWQKRRSSSSTQLQSSSPLSRNQISELPISIVKKPSLPKAWIQTFKKKKIKKIKKISEKYKCDDDLDFRLPVLDTTTTTARTHRHDSKEHNDDDVVEYDHNDCRIEEDYVENFPDFQDEFEPLVSEEELTLMLPSLTTIPRNLFV